MRTCSLLFVVFLTALMGAVNAQAQRRSPVPPPLKVEECSTQQTYTVVDGDILYVRHGEDWKLLLPENPGLPDRVSGPEGQEIAMIYQGDQLCIPAGLLPADFIDNPASSADSTNTGAGLPPSVTTGGAEVQFSAWHNLSRSPWFWMLIVLLIILILILVLSKRRELEQVKEINGYIDTLTKLESDYVVLTAKHKETEDELMRQAQNPVTAGRPLVPGGITLENAEETFLDSAEREWARMGNVTPLPRSMFTILGLRRGHGWGDIGILYRAPIGSKEFTETKELRLKGERVYEASVRFPGIKDPKPLYALEACGNDLLYHGVIGQTTSKDFKFVADEDDRVEGEIKLTGLMPEEFGPSLHQLRDIASGLVDMHEGKTGNGKTPA